MPSSQECSNRKTPKGRRTLKSVSYQHNIPSFTVTDSDKTKSWLYIQSWHPGDFQASAIFLLCSTCTGQPYSESSTCTALRSTIAESPFQCLNEVCQSYSMAPKGWSTSFAGTPSCRHCGAITGHPMSAKQCCPTYLAVPCSTVPKVLMDENAALALFARFTVCSVFSLHTPWIHIMMNLSLWSTVPNHSCQ